MSIQTIWSSIVVGLVLWILTKLSAIVVGFLSTITIVAK